MSGEFEFPVNTGNPALDQQTLGQMRQQYQAAGMTMDAAPLPGGGYHVRVRPAGQAPAVQAGYGPPQAQAGYAPPQAGYGQPQAQAGYGQAPPPQTAAAGYGQAGNGQAAYGQAAYGQQAASQQHQQPHQAQQQQAQAWGQAGWAGAGAMAFAGAGGGDPAMGAGAAAAVAPLGAERVQYLRKVYGLLLAGALVAVTTGFLSTSFGPTVDMVSPEGIAVQVPIVTALMLGSETMMAITFGVLFVGTFLASFVSKVPVLNVIALMAVAALMGVQMAPMIFVAQFYAGYGATMSAAPVRDAGLMTMAVFVGITVYVFATRKDFSYLKAALNMGFWVVLAGCIMTFFLESEVLALAVASAGALLSAGFLLYVTSWIFRNSKMDDAVGDALAMLVQLRNLFMFLLRIFMSRR